MFRLIALVVVASPLIADIYLEKYQDDDKSCFNLSYDFRYQGTFDCNNNNSDTNCSLPFSDDYFGAECNSGTLILAYDLTATKITFDGEMKFVPVGSGNWIAHSRGMFVTECCICDIYGKIKYTSKTMGRAFFQLNGGVPPFNEDDHSFESTEDYEFTMSEYLTAGQRYEFIISNSAEWNGGIDYRDFEFSYSMTFRPIDNYHDCNNNGSEDHCDIVYGVSQDINTDWIPDECQLGDLNCDGFVNFDDIDPFVLVLVRPSDYIKQYPSCSISFGDTNADGFVDFNDIDGFVDLLTK